VTLAVGCRFAEVGTGSYGAPPVGPLVHVDVDPVVPGRNYPAQVAAAADGAAFVSALLERLEPRRRDDALRSRIAGGHARVLRRWRERPGRGGVAPARLLEALQQRLGVEAVFATDSGNGTFLAAECLRLDAPGRFLAPVDYSCMGYAIPAAVGAALGRPGAPVVALSGDGAFLMTGLELLTAAARGVPLLVVVLRDGELAQIAQFQRTALRRTVGSRLPDYDLAALCRGVGVECRTVGEDAQVADSVRWAAAATGEGRPVVLEALVDYSQPTYFTQGVVRTNFRRLPWAERIRFAGRALARTLVAP
jgi:acetolactate synthase-1/2/3 large subunit